MDFAQAGEWAEVLRFLEEGGKVDRSLCRCVLESVHDDEDWRAVVSRVVHGTRFIFGHDFLGTLLHFEEMFIELLSTGRIDLNLFVVGDLARHGSLSVVKHLLGSWQPNGEMAETMLTFSSDTNFAYLYDLWSGRDDILFGTTLWMATMKSKLDRVRKLLPLIKEHPGIAINCAITCVRPEILALMLDQLQCISSEELIRDTKRYLAKVESPSPQVIEIVLNSGYIPANERVTQWESWEDPATVEVMVAFENRAGPS